MSSCKLLHFCIIMPEKNKIVEDFIPKDVVTTHHELTFFLENFLLLLSRERQQLHLPSHFDPRLHQTMISLQ